MRHLPVLLITCAAACGSDDPGPLRVEATVTYAGAAHGTLVVAAFASAPPMGPPVSFAQESSPAFPQVVVLTDSLVADATVHVLAMLDVAPASPQQPGPEDRTVWSDPIELGAAGATEVSLTLVDP